MDSFAFGMCVFELLTGQLPKQIDLVELVTEHLEGGAQVLARIRDPRALALSKDGAGAPIGRGGSDSRDWACWGSETAKFDPETGLPVERSAASKTARQGFGSDTARFDPETGLPIERGGASTTTKQGFGSDAARFDSETGKPLKPPPAKAAGYRDGSSSSWELRREKSQPVSQSQRKVVPRVQGSGAGADQNLEDPLISRTTLIPRTTAQNNLGYVGSGYSDDDDDDLESKGGLISKGLIAGGSEGGRGRGGRGRGCC
jgi:hypothetical protein